MHVLSYCFAHSVALLFGHVLVAVDVAVAVAVAVVVLLKYLINILR